MRAELNTSLSFQFKISALVNVLSVVGMNQLQQVGKWLGKEEIEAASVDLPFNKLRREKGKREQQSLEGRQDQGKVFHGRKSCLWVERKRVEGEKLKTQVRKDSLTK